MKIKKTCQTAKLILPFVEVFSDYHDIEIKQDTLNEVGFKVKTSEIFYDDDDGGYWGLFYAGKMPSKKEIKFLIDIEKESSGY